MVNKHLTDDEVQQYAIDKFKCKESIAGHIHFCEQCRAKVEVYQLLISGIKQQPGVAFDFDLSAAVLGQLSIPKTANDKLLTWIFVFICTCLIGIVFYFFRGYLDSIFKGVGAISIYLVAISAVTVIIWVFVEMYKKNQKEMRILDLY